MRENFTEECVLLRLHQLQSGLLQFTDTGRQGVSGCRGGAENIMCVPDGADERGTVSRGLEKMPSTYIP